MYGRQAGCRIVAVESVFAPETPSTKHLMPANASWLSTNQATQTRHSSDHRRFTEQDAATANNSAFLEISILPENSVAPKDPFAGDCQLGRDRARNVVRLGRDNTNQKQSGRQVFSALLRAHPSILIVSHPDVSPVSICCERIATTLPCTHGCGKYQAPKRPARSPLTTPASPRTRI
jgi:hypothetical protein